MRRTLFLLATVPGLLAAQTSGLQDYRLDAGHSIIEFSIPFAFSRIKGRFTDATGTILYDSSGLAHSSITVVIQTKSLDTGWPHRDEHLRTSDFFDVEKFPTIVFQSQRLTRNGAGWIADGTLTMHGVTKDVRIPFSLPQPPTRSPESNWMILNAVGALKLARADFGIFGGSAFNSWFSKARQATMGDSVEIDLEIEAWRADAQSLRVPVIVQRLEQVRTQGIQTQLDRLAEARRTTPDSTFGRYLLGSVILTRALIGENRVRDAVTLSRTLTELFPTATQAWMMHGVALAVSGDARGAARQYAKAKEVFRPTPRDPNEKFPQVDETWYYLDQTVRLLIEWGRAGQAVPVARTISELYPEIARAQTTYGWTLAASGDATGAAAAYARALALDANETQALELRRRL